MIIWSSVCRQDGATSSATITIRHFRLITSTRLRYRQCRHVTKAVSVNPTTNTIYVGQGVANATTENRLCIINCRTDKVANIVKLSSSPNHMAVNSFTNAVYNQ